MGPPRDGWRDIPESRSGCVCVVGSLPVSLGGGGSSRLGEILKGVDPVGLVPAEGEPGRLRGEPQAQAARVGVLQNPGQEG